MPITLSETDTPEVSGPNIQRVRHELRRRKLTVESAVRITPAMLRLVLSGDDVADFISLGFDDHVKLFVPGTDERRDYTPRRFDRDARTLTIDFAIHDAGPATQWAMGAQVGDTVEVGGPRGSAIIPGDVRKWLLVGDETALPAIGRRIEEATAGEQITSVVAVNDDDEHQIFQTQADVTSFWVHWNSSEVGNPAAILAVLDTIDLTPDTFVWVAAEAGVARAVRDHLTTCGHPRNWIKAAGYWMIGKTDTHEKIP